MNVSSQSSMPIDYSPKGEIRQEAERYTGFTTLAQTVVFNNKEYTIRHYIPSGQMDDKELKKGGKIYNEMQQVIEKMVNLAIVFNLGKEKGGDTVSSLTLSRDGKTLTRKIGEKVENKNIEEALVQKEQKIEKKLEEALPIDQKQKAEKQKQSIGYLFKNVIKNQVGDDKSGQKPPKTHPKNDSPTTTPTNEGSKSKRKPTIDPSTKKQETKAKRTTKPNAVLISKPLGSTKVSIVTGDITNEVGIDAIVNAANSQLAEGGGVCGAIYKASRGGKKTGHDPISKEIKAKYPNGCQTGEAVITGSGEMGKKKIKHVIHTPGPDARVAPYKGNPKLQGEMIYNSYYNSLICAMNNGVKKITFPSISTSIFEVDPKIAAPQALKAIADFEKKFPGKLQEIRLIFKGHSDSLKAMQNEFQKL